MSQRINQGESFTSSLESEAPGLKKANTMPTEGKQHRRKKKLGF